MDQGEYRPGGPQTWEKIDMLPRCRTTMSLSYLTCNAQSTAKVLSATHDKRLFLQLSISAHAELTPKRTRFSVRKACLSGPLSKSATTYDLKEHILRSM